MMSTCQLSVRILHTKEPRGKTTPLANQLIIIPQMDCRVCCSQPVQARAELKIKTAKNKEPGQIREIKEVFVSERERTVSSSEGL